uniref:Uncharacterized protein n=1 Tax=Arundo donax TaxID=35708 RepID=A0A0A9CGS5_ARUDO
MIQYIQYIGMQQRISMNKVSCWDEGSKEMATSPPHHVLFALSQFLSLKESQFSSPLSASIFLPREVI